MRPVLCLNILALLTVTQALPLPHPHTLHPRGFRPMMRGASAGSSLGAGVGAHFGAAGGLAGMAVGAGTGTVLGGLVGASVYDYVSKMYRGYRWVTQRPMTECTREAAIANAAKKAQGPEAGIGYGAVQEAPSVVYGGLIGAFHGAVAGSNAGSVGGLPGRIAGGGLGAVAGATSLGGVAASVAAASTQLGKVINPELHNLPWYC